MRHERRWHNCPVNGCKRSGFKSSRANNCLIVYDSTNCTMDILGIIVRMSGNQKSSTEHYEYDEDNSQPMHFAML